MGQLPVVVGSPLPGTMEEQDQRVLFGSIHIRGKMDSVVQGLAVLG
jgi:hypothetical protein